MSGDLGTQFEPDNDQVLRGRYDSRGRKQNQGDIRSKQSGNRARREKEKGMAALGSHITAPPAESQSLGRHVRNESRIEPIGTNSRKVNTPASNNSAKAPATHTAQQITPTPRSNGKIASAGTNNQQNQPVPATPMAQRSAVRDLRVGVFLYCGKRRHHNELIPLTDEELSNMYEPNEYADLPYVDELLEVIHQLENEREVEQATQIALMLQGRNSQRGGNAGLVASTSKKSFKRRRPITFDMITSRCLENGFSIDMYLVPEERSLPSVLLERLQLFVKNRCLYTFSWTIAFKEACVRDAIGIDKNHPAFGYCVGVCTQIRSTMQAKALSKAHAYAHRWMGGSGKSTYTMLAVGLPQTVTVMVDGEEQNVPRLPDSSLFPKHYASIDTVKDIFNDIADAIDWSRMFKDGDTSNALNHLGESAVLKTIGMIQIECVNALPWFTKDGMYVRPLDKKTGKPVKQNRSDVVLEHLHWLDTECRAEIPCPKEKKARNRLRTQGLPVPKEPITRLGCLYPLPKYMISQKYRRGTESLEKGTRTSEFAQAFGEVNESDQEDYCSSSENDDLEEDNQGEEVGAYDKDVDVISDTDISEQGYSSE